MIAFELAWPRIGPEVTKTTGMAGYNFREVELAPVSLIASYQHRQLAMPPLQTVFVNRDVAFIYFSDLANNEFSVNSQVEHYKC